MRITILGTDQPEVVLVFGISFCFIKKSCLGIPGGPVVKTWLFHSRGLGSIPGRELESFHKLSGMAKKIK